MKVLNLYYEIDKPNVFCKVVVGKKKGIKVSAPGFSRCSPQDKWSETAGKELAFTRAMLKAVKKYHKELEQEMHKGRDYKPTDEVVVTVETAHSPKKEFHINALMDSTVADLFPTGKTTCDSDMSRRLREFMEGASVDILNEVAHDW